jgi:hypothetical protein
MPIMLNTILREAGLPLPDVRLLRHKDKRAKQCCTPYELWRDDRLQFELYQSTQSIPNRHKLNAPCWAVFVVDPSDETMFAGLYAVKCRGLLEEDTPMPRMDGIDKAGSCDVYDLRFSATLCFRWSSYRERNEVTSTFQYAISGRELIYVEGELAFKQCRISSCRWSAKGQGL